MTSISRLQQILLSIRSSRSSGTSQNNADIGATTRSTPPTTTSRPRIEDDLRNRLHKLDVSADDFPTRSRIEFVEAALIREFGDAVSMDPRLSSLVAQIAQQIEADVAARTQLDETLRKIAVNRT